jgi:hypothetical protein
MSIGIKLSDYSIETKIPFFLLTVDPHLNTLCEADSPAGCPDSPQALESTNTIVPDEFNLALHCSMI